MASLSLQNIKKEYPGGYVAVPDFSLEIEDKEFVIFVGPSGCGKSTTLRMIAGLEEISGGKLFIDGKLVNDVSPKDRDIAMVFQNYALYPHMTNYENMAFGLKLRKMPKDEIDRRVHEAARILGIEQFLERKPAALSGGQRQRVAMGRAIVREPKVFLMDEPLSNLDAKLRGEMRTQIAKLHKDLQTTFIYVTHDQIEAMTLGTKIVVMKDGVTQQVDSPANLYNRPCNLFVAGFIGSPTMNFVNARVQERGEDLFILFGDDAIKLPDGKVKELRENKTFRDYIGREVVMGIRPEDLHDEEVFLQAYPETVVNAEVELTELMGSEIHLHLVVNGQDMTAKVNPRSTAKVGDKIKLGIDAQKIHLFDKETERAILN